MMKPSLLAIAILLLLPLLSGGQSRWVREYYEGLDLQPMDIEVSYDGGYLLAGWIDNSRFDWLIKTDINGEILWEKRIGDFTDGFSIFSMSQNSSGEIYIAGLGTRPGSNYDPAIIKLNNCGEKEWCKVMPTEAENDYASDICALDNGGCTVSLKYSGPEYDVDRVCLLGLNSAGEVMWKQCYNGIDSNIFGIDHEDLLHTPDNGYLITGSCSYSNSIPPVYYRSLAYLVKTDSIGQLQWELVVEKEDSIKNWSAGLCTVMSPDGLSYYTMIRHEIHGTEYGYTPALLKTGTGGNVEGIYDLASPGDYTHARYECAFVNDSTLAATASWGDEPINIKPVLINLQGVIQKEVTLQNPNTYSYLRVDRDKKILIFSGYFKEDELDVDVLLYKFNRQLINDTLYLQPFRYDSLCAHPIISDTVFINDCDLILGIDDEAEGERPSRDIVQVWPNPCRSSISISFDKHPQAERIDFYNVYGQILYSRKIRIDERQLNIDTEAFPPGIIIAVLRANDNQTFTKKIIKL